MKEKIEDILEISNTKKNKEKHIKIDSDDMVFLRAVKNTFVFFLIFLIGYSILFSDISYRNNREMISLFFVILAVIIYSVKTNLNQVGLSILYSFVIIMLLLYGIDIRTSNSTHAYIFLSILIASIIFYWIKRERIQNSFKNNFPTELDSSIFSFIGILENEVKDICFVKGKELRLNNISTHSFRPQLVGKIINDDEQIVLKYSNKNELSFTVLITRQKKVYINHWKENVKTRLINRLIYEELNKICKS